MSFNCSLFDVRVEEEYYQIYYQENYKAGQTGDPDKQFVTSL